MTTSMDCPLPRLPFGNRALDEALGGGLLPGTLTVVAGATGVGKTQLGIQWAAAGKTIDAVHRTGAILDLTSRGDSQSHAEYARRLAGWVLSDFPAAEALDVDKLWPTAGDVGDAFRPFVRAGRRVTRKDLDPDDWHAWKTDLARTLRTAAAFLYSHFLRGTRRVLVDGIEPSDRMSESIQFEFFEYLYHQVIRREDEWTARELLREHYRANEPHVMAHRYEERAIACAYLYTTPHVFLDDLMAQPIGEGDVFANANTIILMGRTRNEGEIGRALYIAKHRGSACSDRVLPYRLTDRGLVFG